MTRSREFCAAKDMLYYVVQAVELRERLRQLEAEVADLQAPSAIELQQSAVEGMEAAGVCQ